jgi:hypothetical protein
MEARFWSRFMATIELFDCASGPLLDGLLSVRVQVFHYSLFVRENEVKMVVCTYRRTESRIVESPEVVAEQGVCDPLKATGSVDIDELTSPDTPRQHTLSQGRRSSPVPVRVSEPAGRRFVPLPRRLGPECRDRLDDSVQYLLQQNKSANHRSITGFVNPMTIEDLSYLVQSHVGPVPCREQNRRVGAIPGILAPRDRFHAAPSLMGYSVYP